MNTTKRLPTFSNDDDEAFAATAETPTNQEPPIAHCSMDESQQKKDLTYASDEWLINEPPKRARSTDAPLGGARGPRRPRRPQSAGVTRNAENVLLQPVLPSALSYSSEHAADGRVLVDQGDQREQHDQEMPQDSQQRPTAEKGTENKLHDASGKVDIAQTDNVRQSPDLLGNDTRHSSGHTNQKGDPKSSDIGADIVDPMRMDSAVLFASLSSSTAGATLSSKSMARVEGKGGNSTAGAVGRSRQQGKVSSSSTFALSVDDDDTSMTLREKKDELAVQSSASLNAQSLPQIERPLVAAEKGDAIVGDVTAVENVGDTPENRRGPPVPSSSASVPPVSTKSEHDDSPEIRQHLISAPTPSKGKPTGHLEGAPTDSMGSESAPLPRAATTSSTQAGSARCSGNGEPGALREDSKQSPQRDRPEDNPGKAGNSPTLGSEPQPSTTDNSGYHRSTPSPLDEATTAPPPTLAGDLAVETAETAGNDGLGHNEDEGDAIGYLDEGQILSDHDGNGFGHMEEDDDASLDRLDAGIGAGATAATSDHEGSVGALEDRSLVEANSSHSGSVLDVGRGAAGSSDDDGGYF